MNALVAHIEAINAGMQARMDEEPGLICFMLTTDVDHWNASGVYTVADFEAAMDAEYEREMRKQAMYDHYDDDPHTTTADWLYYDMMEREGTPDAHVQEYAYQQWLDEQVMRKWGVDTIIMIPTHFEQMAIRAGFMEY